MYIWRAFVIKQRADTYENSHIMFDAGNQQHTPQPAGRHRRGSEEQQSQLLPPPAVSVLIFKAANGDHNTEQQHAEGHEADADCIDTCNPWRLLHGFKVSFQDSHKSRLELDTAILPSPTCGIFPTAYWLGT